GFSYCFDSKPNSFEDPERALYWFHQAVWWENANAQEYIDKIKFDTEINIGEDKLRQWRSDFENHHYLTTEQMIPDGTKYQRL
ncbi:MAG: hypothetical protein ACI4PP_05560, partial [Clostridia bacterium]